MCSEDHGCCGHAGHACECSSILSGLLRPCLLLLIAEGKGSHGYELSSALEELGLDVKAEGGRLYRALRHLEAEGLVRSEWDTQTPGAARRVYSATVAGRKYLEDTAGSVGAAVEALNRLATRLRRLGDASETSR